MTNLEKGLIAIGINLVLILILFKIIDIVDRKITNKIKNTESDSPLLRFLPLLMKLLKGLVLFIAGTGILQSQGYSISSILAGFGIGGIAVGMAAKDAIANIFGSFEILSDHVYKVGEYIKIDNIEGTVEDINMRSTKVRNLDNFLISVPNNIAANAVVTNLSRAEKRFINLTIGITYSTDNNNIIKAQEILKELASAHPDIHDGFFVAVDDLGDSSINIKFKGYVKSGSLDNLMQVKGEFLQNIIKRYREENIDFAFPSRSIYIESDSPKIEN